MLKDEKVRDEMIEPERAVKSVPAKKSVNVDKFIARKLKVINEWPDGVKKREAIERLFRNKEAKV